MAPERVPDAGITMHEDNRGIAAGAAAVPCPPSMDGFRSSLMVIAAAAAFGALAWFCVLLTRDESRIAAVWLPNALLIAILFRTRRTPAWLFIVACFGTNIIANLLAGDSAFRAIMLSLINSIEIGTVWSAMVRLDRPRPDMADPDDLLTFCLVGGLFAPLLAGIMAVYALVGTTVEAGIRIALSWAASDALGMLLVSPTLLILADAWLRRHRPSRQELLDWSMLFVISSAITIGVFSQESFPFLFLVTPVVVLGAFRQGQVGAAFAIIFISIIASVGTANGHGPVQLVHGGLSQKLMVLQVFLAIAFAMGLPIAAILRSRAETVERLREARLVAEQAVAAKSIFLANMSHEIRTPMNGVIGFTDVLLAGHLSDEQRRHVEMLAESGRSMMRLLNDILDISRIEAGQMQIENEPFELLYRLEDATRLMRPIAERKGVDLALSTHGKIPAWIMGDQLRVRQILLNLIGNAVKFTEHGKVRVRVSVDRTDAGPKLVVAIRDSGIGIADDQLSQIFVQFSQADSSIASRFGGSGLGLTISTQLARAMGGGLSVESKLGVGTTFTLTLPLVEAASGNPRSREARPAQMVAKRRSERPRVLLAEDNETNQALILAMAERVGIDVDVALTGAQVVPMAEAARLERRPYRLVLMDMRMPEVGGIEATRRLRAAGFDEAELPIIAQTANAYADDIAACIDAGMQGHLTKPIRLNDLEQIMMTYFEAPPVAAEPGDEMVAITSGALFDKYQASRTEARILFDGLRQQATLTDADKSELMSRLHNLAGTGAYFGEGDLGVAAVALERALENAPHDKVKAILDAHAGLFIAPEARRVA